MQAYLPRACMSLFALHSGRSFEMDKPTTQLFALGRLCHQIIWLCDEFIIACHPEWSTDMHKYVRKVDMHAASHKHNMRAGQHN
jgi:hypothetical protein